MPEEQPITEIDLLQALVSSQTNLSEQNSLIIEMLQILLPQPQSEESQEPSLKEMMLHMLEQQELIINQLSSQSRTSEPQSEATETASKSKIKELQDE